MPFRLTHRGNIQLMHKFHEKSFSFKDLSVEFGHRTTAQDRL